MKKILFLAIGLLVATSATAQRISVVDDQGNGIHLVTVLTEDGNMIGITNLEGMTPDLGGAVRIVLTHVAFKPQLVEVAKVRGGKVMMEDADYDLPEVQVVPKPYAYVETYYRAYGFINDSLRYFTAGIMPNAYDMKTKKLLTGSYSRCRMEAYLTEGISITWGLRAEELNAGMIHKSGASRLQPGGDAAEKYFTTLTDEGGGKQRVSNPEGTVGFIISDEKQTHLTLDGAKAQIYRNKVLGQERVMKLREKKDYEYQFVEVFNHDEDGQSDITDLVMYSNHWEWNGTKGRNKLIIETYAAERAYMDKKEFKARKDELKKQYKWPLSLDTMEGYATSHGIPALAPSLRKAIEKLPKKM
ncbi:MAG: hypothetical protein IJ148_02890 [Bacteroidaceae bacterium]|nr:hypothetical protein [Bacteroidaceae bacterium]MBQ9169757.1 hypothetical protein [Bacteroidaceae bacterium]